MDSQRAATLNDTGINLVPYFLDSLREQINTAWNAFVKACKGGDGVLPARRELELPLDSTGQGILAELAKFESCTSSGSSTLLSLEMLQLALMCIALQPEHPTSEQSGAGGTKRASSSATATAAAAALKVNESLRDHACALGVATLRNLEQRLSADGSAATATGLSPADAAKWFESILSVYEPFVAVLKTALCGVAPWDPAGAPLGYLARLLFHLLQTLGRLAGRQSSQKKAFQTFVKAGAVELTLQTLDALMKLADLAPPASRNGGAGAGAESVEGTGTGRDKEPSAREFLVGQAYRLLDAAIGLQTGKDVEELASAAGQVTQAAVGGSGPSPQGQAQTPSKGSASGKKRGRDDDTTEKVAVAYGTSYYVAFYDSIAKYAQRPLEMPTSTAVSVHCDRAAGSTYAPAGGAALLYLYSLGSLRVALADKLGTEKGGAGLDTQGKGEDVAGAKDAARDAERTRIKDLLASGDAGALLSYVSNAAISRRHIARMLGVTNAMVLRASPAVTSDVGSAEDLHQTFCRVKLIEALSSALQSSLPTHDSLEVHVEPFRAMTRRSVAQLQQYNNSTMARPAAHVALELCCIHRLTSLDHRFLIQSSENTDISDGNGDGDGDGTGTLLRKVYESLVLTNMPEAEDASLQDDAFALQSSQQDVLLLLIHLHAELSRLDMLVRDLCNLAALGKHEQSHMGNLHRLLGSDATQAKLTACFASIPALQRHAVWEALASACTTHMKQTGDDAVAAQAAFAAVLSLLVRPLSNAHTTTENVRGPASFTAPEPGPLYVLLQYAVSQLDTQVAISSTSKAKPGKKLSSSMSVSVGNLAAHAHAHTIAVAILRVGASALAQLSPSEVTGGAWDPLAQLACSKLSTCSAMLAPLVGLEFSAAEANAIRIESILCACGALLALANFSAIASARLGNTAEVSVSADLPGCIANTLMTACQSYQKHGVASEAILLPVIHLFVQHARSWSHLGPQLRGSGQLRALSELLLRSQEVLLDSGDANQTGLLRKHVVDAPLLSAALRAATKMGVSKLKTLLKKTKNEKGAVEGLVAATKGLDLCLRHLPPNLTDTVASGDAAADEETSGLVKDLVALLSLTAEHATPTAPNSDEARNIGCVVSTALLRHVRACASMQTIDDSVSHLYGEKGIRALITLACAGSSVAEEEGASATVNLTCLLLDARLIALLTGSHTVDAKVAEAEIASIFTSLRTELQLAPLAHQSLENVRSLNSAVCTALTAVDWALASSAPFAALVLKELNLVLEPLLVDTPALKEHTVDPMRAEAYYIAADAMRARDRIRSARKSEKDANAMGRGSGAMALPAMFTTSIARSNSAIREAWLLLLGTYLHSQRFQGYVLDAAGRDHISSLLCDTLCGHGSADSNAQMHSSVPTPATMALVVSGLLLASPAMHVSSLCARLASSVQQYPLLSLRLSAAIVEAATLNSRHLGTESLVLAQQLLVLAPRALQHPPLRHSASLALEEQTLAFYSEAFMLLRRVLGMERNASSTKTKRRPAKGASAGGAEDKKGGKSLRDMEAQGQGPEGEDEGAVSAAWAPVAVGLVSQLSAHAVIWCQLQQSSGVVCHLAHNTLTTAEALLLGCTHDILSTGAGALVVAVTQCVHMVLHLPARVPTSVINVPIGAACRVFTALAQHKDASRQTPLLLSIVLDLIGNTTYSIPKERVESLQPGMFALIDRCAGPKESKHALAPLGEGARAVHAELYDKYVREYKFKGRV